MSYAGNPNLAPDVQKRIVDTFLHSLDSAGKGRIEEARLGCDFIQQLDPLFTPAQTLGERLHGAGGPVAVDDLRARVGGAPAAAPAPARPAAPAATNGGAALIRQELERLVATRDFATLGVRAQAAQAAIAADPGLQQLMGQAQELMEAAPYVDKFLQKASAARAAGNAGEARSLLDKARALDPGHPGIAALSAPLAAAAAPAFTLDDAPAELSFDSTALPLELPPLELPDLEASSPSVSRLGSDLSVGLGGGLGSEPGAAFGLEPPSLGDLPELSLDDVGGGGHAYGAAAPAGAASDPDPRIAELLDDGQALYERGELQGAIDAWSRIFLIDIDHQEAAHRIERARTAKAEQERQIEEAYHEALAQVQAGNTDDAKQTLEHVLRLQPNHVAARDALGKLERGESLEAPRAAAATSAAEVGGAALPDFGDDADLKEEIMVPPEPGSSASRATPAPVRPAARRPLLLGAVVGLVLILGGGWYLRANWDRLFPNTERPKDAIKRIVEQTPIRRATQLHKEGKRAIAIAQLKRVPPASPYYEEAQALISQWEAEEAAAQAKNGPSPEQQARREALLEQVKQAQGERRYLGVMSLLDQMATIAPLSADEQAMRTEAEEKVQPLQKALSMLHAEEYDQAARQLWQLYEKDKENADARSLLTTAYYNLAIISLQQGKLEDAETNLKEAANLDPADPDVQRLLQLSETYRERTPDLLYRIYTKYLNPRPI